MKINFDIINANPAKLPAEFKAKWLAALRGGSYKQTSGYLHTSEGFCCLGVACDLTGTKWDDFGVAIDITPVKTRYKTVTTNATGMPLHGDLPEEVMYVLLQQTNAPTAMPDITFEGTVTDDNGDHTVSVMYALASLNDAKYPFADIADWIDANL
jgi:hypothetical protein